MTSFGRNEFGMDETWSQIGRVPSQPSREMFTIAGRAFCVSGRSGDIDRQGHLGFFSDDTRFLSEFKLSINGSAPEVVGAATLAPYEAVFYLRGRTLEQDERAEPGLVIRRHRYQGSSLHEDIIIDNHSGRPTTVTVDFGVDADFADLFDIRLGGSVLPRAIVVERAGDGIVFTYRGEGFTRASAITASVPIQVREGHLIGECHIAEGGRWKACFDVVPVVDGTRREVDRSCTNVPKRVPPRQLHIGSDRPRLRSSADALEHLWAHALIDLEALEIEIDGTRAFAAGIPWFVTLFGRDSIISSMEAMLVDRDAALGTARLLARLQGTQTVPATSEEPGKILHELRHGERSFPLDQMSRYFGAVDTTPLWCMLVEKLWRWGTEPAEIEELLPALRAAVAWIHGALETGGGFLTYTGDATRLVNQCWKDSEDSIVDAFGRLLEPPIAVVEAQAYAVAALRSAARLEQDLGDASRSPALMKEAADLQMRLEAAFWRDELGTFDMAIGRDGNPARSLSSNPGHVLWAEAATPEKAVAVAASLVDDSLWSGWGVRTLSRHHPAYHPISYHRGSVWPHDTMLAIAGLISNGHVSEALTLSGGLLAAAADFSYELPELFSGIARREVPRPIGYPASSSPQAWAAAVPIYLTEQLLGLRPDLPAGQLIVAPRLPAGVELSLDHLPLGEGFLSLQAEGRSVRLLELPTGLNVIVR